MIKEDDLEKNINTNINQFINNNSLLFELRDDISVNCFEQRERLIVDIIKINNVLSENINWLNKKLEKLKNIQHKDIQKLTNVLSKVNNINQQNKEWIPVVKKKKDTHVQQTKVNITKTLTLTALSVPNFSDIHKQGELYYISNADHFAIILEDQLIHGNIGTIYYNHSTIPERIKDCKFIPECKNSNCTYYHNPIKFPGSKERRNYLSSWIFNEKYKYKKFGDLDSLDVDILNISNEEIDKFKDQVMHYLLCLFLLSQNKKI